MMRSGYRRLLFFARGARQGAIRTAWAQPFERLTQVVPLEKIK
jgi:hypothetical protein